MLVAGEIGCHARAEGACGRVGAAGEKREGAGGGDRQE